MSAVILALQTLGEGYINTGQLDQRKSSRKCHCKIGSKFRYNFERKVRVGHFRTWEKQKQGSEEKAGGIFLESETDCSLDCIMENSGR